MWVPRVRSSVSPRVFLAALLICATAGCGGSTDTSLVGPSDTKCGIAVTNNTPEVPAAGGNGSLTVTTQRECAWSARADAPWISLSGTSGQGTSSVNYSVGPNPNGTPRRGRVVVSQQAVEVAQAAAPCRYEVSPSSVDVEASGGQVSVTLHAPDGCSWSVDTDVPWIRTASASAGAGGATVRFTVASNDGERRTGRITIGEATVRVTQARPGDPPLPPPAPAPPTPAPPGPGPAPCTYEAAPAEILIGPAAGQSAIAVTAPDGCAWAASASAPWITIASGASGSGNGSVVVAVSENTGSARKDTVSVAGRTVTIEQEARPAPTCTYTLTPETRTVAREQQEFDVEVNAPSGCAWTASSEASWMSVVDGRSGSGSGRFRVAVAANGGGARTGVVRVAGATFTLHQAEGACTYSIKPTYYDAGRGPDDIAIDVTAESGCAWTTTTDAAWVTVAEGRTGSGNGPVRLLVDANTGPPRSAIVTIAGNTFTLTQGGTCTYDIKPNDYHSGRGPDDVDVSVTAPAGCTWTAASHAAWVTIAEGGSGSGDGTVRLLVEANSGPARATELTIAGEAFALTQNGCPTRIKPTWYHAGRGPDDIRILVTADPGCSWTASSSVAWVRVAEGQTGSGSGTVRLLVDPNSGAERAVTLTIAGQPFDLRQNGSQ